MEMTIKYIFAFLITYLFNLNFFITQTFQKTANKATTVEDITDLHFEFFQELTINGINSKFVHEKKII